ncbi:MAG: 1-deoxy-D-xylulose-5-phosphate synthase, partial [Actinomycetia bacterium]|nr:1-deoxy-D-xylulose-5-phosphate synthase [Actinomycetes bacterium]
MAGRILDSISLPEGLKDLDAAQLEKLAKEIRTEMINVTSTNGGHLGSNLGVVELTIGLHMAIESPKDKIIWDVGHQAYVHKLLTGRKDQFSTLRKYGGISGFPKQSESPHDAFDTGHASNSISVALGAAVARDLRGTDETIIAVIGDGSMTGGMAFEALNQTGHLKTNIIIVLNDNEMSIDGNVGALSCYLNRIRLDPAYNKFRHDIEEAVRRIPGIGEKVVSAGETWKTSLKQLVVPGMLFEELGIKYIGPIDGHDVDAVKKGIAMAKEIDGPILIHVLTKKGLGYQPAEQFPERFHGTSPFNVKTGLPLAKKTRPSYGQVFGESLARLAIDDQKIVAVSAAMAQGTGLDIFAAAHPDRFFDVGIAEQHGVTFAAGMAQQGLKPVVAIYSTFLQRAYDQLVEDICLPGLPVVFALDRGGLVGDDGPTHHGAF